MGVRFIIGRAGTGKTRTCLVALRAAASASPVEGPRLVLLVPEQSGLQMERQVVLGVEGQAAHRVEVLSFRRLANRILTETGGTGLQAISPQARTMLLRWLMVRRAPQLRYYRRCVQQTGFLEELGRTIVECLDAAISPEDLPDCTGEALDDPVRAAKFHDLRLLYRDYLDALSPNRLDPSQFLDVARGRLDGCDWLQGALVWVDGFAGFTRQEQNMLAALGVRAADMWITVLTDPVLDDFHAHAVRVGGNPFARTRRMMAELVATFAELGTGTDPPIVLRHPPRRFEGAPALARLERHLFAAPPSDARPVEGVRVVECPNRRAEVALAVACIHESVRRRTDPLRYRDIGVIVRDLKPYHELISAALTAHGVPFFIDRRRTVSHHPLVELVRGLVALTATDFSIDAVRTLLKSGLLPMDEDAVDAMENHLLATAIHGRTKWTAGDWPAPPRERSGRDGARKEPTEVNVARRRFLNLVDGWTAANDAGSTTGRVWVQRLRAALDVLGVEGTLSDWIRSAGEDGDWEQAAEHRQVFHDVDVVLDDIAGVFGAEPVSVGELGAILDAALSTLTLGLAPAMLDQVLVGSIERSRHPELRLVLLLGMNDGVFPAAPAESSILNDSDRVWLDRSGVPVGAPRSRQSLEEALLFYVACTRPSHGLVVTHAAADEKGRALHPSPYIGAMSHALPGLAVERTGDSWGAREGSFIASPRDLAAELTFEYRHRPDRADDDPVIRGRWNDLYALVREDPASAPFLGRVMRSLADGRRTTPLPVERKGVTAEPAAMLSVSELETFAECAFKHFAHYRLRLRRRPEAALEPNDVGLLHHAVLEGVMRDVIERGESLGSLDEAELTARLAEHCRRVNESLPMAGELSRARDKYLRDRSPDHLGRVLTAQKRVSRAGRFQPAAAELPFGIENRSNLPGLELVTPSGRRVRLRGVIDRVEFAEATDQMLGIVIDYKRKPSDRVRLDLSSVYYGLSLQLLGYALVLARHGSTLAGRTVSPIGAFYAGLLQKYRRVNHPEEAEHADAPMAAYRLRGVFNADHLSALVATQDGGRLATVSAFLKRDGTLGDVNKTDVADGAQFRALLEHTRMRMGELADRILDGEVEVEPCRLRTFTPCAWCEYASLCRYERMQTPIRRLDSMTRVQVFERLTGAADGELHGK